MSNRTKELFIKRINLRESDVKECSDLFTLNSWLLELHKCLADINPSIAQLKINIKNGDLSEQGRWIRQITYKKSITNMILCVCMRIQSSKIDRKRRIGLSKNETILFYIKENYPEILAKGIEYWEQQTETI